MSKASLPSPPPGKASDSGRFVEYDRFIEEQLSKTRSHVRGVDIVGGLMTLVAGALAFFLVAAVADHWLIPGGLGFWGRWLFCAVLVIGAGYYVVTELLPLCLRRINPVYAAYTIERGSPGLKNGLVNFLLLRKQRSALSEPVYQAIEEQAATGLAHAPGDASVDRSRLIKLGYVLIGLLAFAAVYKVLSPKDPLATVGRVVLPWADIQPPTRVGILAVEPGTIQAFRGQRLDVSAEVSGLASDGEVRLVYSTADGQTVNQTIRMSIPADSQRHSCALPDNSAGLQQDLDYHIEAGDARTGTYRVTVVAAPTIVVQAVDYVYPDYTGLAPQHVEHQGDLKAIEGTRVTLHALANQDIKSGAIDFNCDGREDTTLEIDGQKAIAHFTLELSDDRRGPQYATYQLRFRNMAGQENPQPIAHRIEVTPDLPPEIEFLAPKSPDLDVPARASVGLEIVANDPDFALRRVRLLAQVGDRQIADKLVLDEPYQGQFTTKKLRFDTKRTGLNPGDVVEYWAMAEDTKMPQPNRVETAHRRLRIVSPNQQQPNEDQLASRDNDIRPESSSGKPDRNEDSSADGQQQKGGKPERPKDEPRGKGDNEPEQRDSADKSAGKDKPGTDGDNGQRSGDERSDAKQPNNGDQKNADKQHGEKQSGDPQNRDQQVGDKQKGEMSQPQSGGGQKQQSGEQQNGQNGQNGQGGQNGEKGGRSGDQKQQAGEQQNGEKGQGGQNGGQNDDQQPVANDGSDDGSAIEKILQNRQKHGGDSPGDSAPKSSGDGQQPQSGSGEGNQNQGNNQNQGTNQSHGNQGQGSAAKGENSQQKPGSGTNEQQPLKPQSGDKSEGGKADKGLGQPGAGEKPGAAGGQADEKPSPNQPGEAGTKNEPAAGNDTKPADRSEQGSAPGKQQRRPGKKGADETKPQQGDDKSRPGDEHLQGDGNSKPTDDQEGPAQNGGKAKQNDRGQQQGSRSGKGERSQGDTGQKPQKPPSDEAQHSESQGADGNDDKEQSGAGKSGQDKKGSPPAQGNNQQRNKTQDGGGRNGMQPNDTAQSPSNSERQSDSQSDSSGDRSGGGAGGGGQKANKKGTGGAGQNSEADEGAGKASQPGDGETGTEAGDRRKADGATGKSGSEPGKGSSSREKPSAAGGSGKPSEKGDQNQAPQDSQRQNPGQQNPGQGEEQPPRDPAQKGQPNGQNQQADQRPSSKEVKPGQPSSQGGSGQQQGPAAPGGGPPQGGGNQAPEAPLGPQDDSPTPADDPNLDYARKATDLALEHLKDQMKRGEPDQELLDKLGWSKQDLEKFVNRWDQMRRQASQRGPEGQTARKDLDEALRSLGLRPRTTTLQSNKGRDDQSRGLKESRRSQPPAEYAEQFKAYTQGTSRGGK
jgi:hypothetical protein